MANKTDLKNFENSPLYKAKREERAIDKSNRVFKRRKKEKTVFKIACISCIALITMTSFFILEGYSNISQSRMEITQLENRKNELELTKFAMISELEEAKSSVKISEEAKHKLSMDYANKDQVVYLPKEDIVKAKKE